MITDGFIADSDCLTTSLYSGSYPQDWCSWRNPSPQTRCCRERRFARADSQPIRNRVARQCGPRL